MAWEPPTLQVLNGHWNIIMTISLRWMQISLITLLTSSDCINACEKDGADLAIGSRYISGVNVVNWPLGRVLMSYCASLYVRIVTGMKVKDTTAGFKCYRSDVIMNIKPEHIRSIGYGFQIEMKFTAWKLGYKIVEVPIIFTDRKAGTSKMSGGIFNEAFWGVLRMRLRSFFTTYKRNGK